RIHHDGEDVQRATADVVAVAPAVPRPPQALVEQSLDLVAPLQVCRRAPRLEPVLHHDLMLLVERDFGVPFGPRLRCGLLDAPLRGLPVLRDQVLRLATVAKLALVDNHHPRNLPRLPVANPSAAALVQLQHPVAPLVAERPRSAAAGAWGPLNPEKPHTPPPSAGATG